MRPEGSKASIDWDNDFCADPLQVGPDGEDYFIADPRRPVPEDFDKIFMENDEKRLEELERISREIGIGGTIPTNIVDDLKVSSRAATPTDGLGRRAGQASSVPETNVVDPFGNRRPRFGTRQKAANSKAILERMQQRDEVIKEALADISYDLTGEGEPRDRRPPAQYDTGTSSGWVVRRSDGATGQAGGGRGNFQARKDPERPGFVQIRKLDSGAEGRSRSPYSRFAQRQVLLFTQPLSGPLLPRALHLALDLHASMEWLAPCDALRRGLMRPVRP